MEKENILENYQKYLKQTKHLATSTLKRRIQYAKSFLNYLEENHLIFSDVTKDTINTYFNLSPARKDDTASFIEYLVTYNIISLSPTQQPKTTHSYKEILDSYLRHIKMKGVSERTIEITHSLLSRFLDYLKSHNITEISSVTKKVISDYSTHLLLYRTKKGKPYNASTRANILINIKTFLEFLCKENILLSNPAEDVELPKLPQKISRDIPTVEEIDRLIASIDKSSTTGIRDTAIIETLYGTGIRGNELIKLEVRDIDFENNFITIREGKGKKDRTVPVNNTALYWIDRYLKTRQDNSKFLFLNNKGEKLTTNSLRKLITKYSQKAGIKKHLIPHSFRYACATHMLKNGADIRYIQQMLGHDNLYTTQGYTKVFKADLKRMLRRFHPRDTGGIQ